jgi:hypothetical protein
MKVKHVPIKGEYGMKAVIDRIVDQKHAVLLVGDKETEIIVSTGMLPPEAVEGSIVQIELDNKNQVTKLVLDQKETNEVKDRVSSMMEKLQGNKRSRYKME